MIYLSEHVLTKETNKGQLESEFDKYFNKDDDLVIYTPLDIFLSIYAISNKTLINLINHVESVLKSDSGIDYEQFTVCF